MIKVLLLLLLTVCVSKPEVDTTAKYSKSNAGHRLGADVIKEFPDNTLEVLKAFISVDGHKHKSFKYFEFDVNSTADNKLVVYHDKNFKKKEFKNKPFYKKYIKDMTLEEVRKIKLSGKYQIPTLIEVMDVLKTLEAKTIVEVKLIHTDVSRNRLIETIDSYRKPKWYLAYLAFPKAFKKSFPNKDKWCKKLKLIHKAGKAKNSKNNLCK